MITKLYLLSKKIHRLCLFATIMLIFVMGGTGVIMKYPGFFDAIPFIDPILMRGIHAELSIYFLIALTIMMLTGTYMYLFPILNARKKMATQVEPVKSEVTPSETIKTV